MTGSMSGSMSGGPETLWVPPDDVRRSTTVGRYLTWLADERGLEFDTYDQLWTWSVDDLDGFWSSVWSFFEVRSSQPYDSVLPDPTMPGATWFPGARLNYAERALATTGDGVAIVARSQSVAERSISWDELRDLVARCRAGLLRLGVTRGDRVVGYLPNGPEAVVAFLATASLGAIWASCPPEFGARSVIDRFGQLDPVVLFVTRGYRYGDKDVRRDDEVAAVVDALPTVRSVVDLDDDWGDLLSAPADLSFEQVPFDHPLYVLFSSGTTGPPKAIVHGHGGILVEHLKALALHHDLGPDDRFFWFSTTGWMMWNLLVSGLCVGSTIVLFDGDPTWPDLGALWRMAAETRITVFGVSAPFLMTCRNAGLDVGRAGDLAALRSVGSTGAPLPVEGFEWVYEQLPDVWLTSVSGGTDVCTAFVGGSPLVPVVAGEISCRYLGARVEAFDDDGRSVVGRQGELVVTAPLPSMPVGFWGDSGGDRYRAAYFTRFPGVWCHGDWVTITERGSCIISGRSDSTLNRGGVRLGTSEFYAVVEAIPGIRDCLVVHLEDAGGGAGQLLLFVSLDEGRVLDGDLETRIASELRSKLSPRHVPNQVFEVPVIPRTHSGKKLEVPVKRILLGAAPDTVASIGSLADPTALDAFVELSTRRA
ncbi:MAG: acetoacetate--CoA ligase [Acidimicrobiales bacterium]